MSNTIPIRDHYRLIPAAICALLLCACGNGSASKAEEQSPAQVAAHSLTDQPETGGAPALPLSDAGEVSQTSRTISMEEMPQKFPQRGNEPGCFITFAYADYPPETLIWSGEPCAALTTLFTTPADLKKHNDWDRLDQETQNQILKLPDQKVFYVGGEFTASIYPLGINNLTYEVTVAD